MMAVWHFHGLSCRQWFEASRREKSGHAPLPWSDGSMERAAVQVVTTTQTARRMEDILRPIFTDKRSRTFA